ncbi:hypothetical protein SAMN05421504_104428 [Amycolatopsis xylanica]|uniref:Uncharacterized protein n=1 Tax=Amycolatopsis xylanica TaxID=589385 RepID=A0A1H3GWL8_9PSEU|nr:hypothetical protein [Amycolatopsis xylanica]SDY07713.1 hypothetical protein SAMN05421504_104428 [Amycolatopsis xylanica]
MFLSLRKKRSETRLVCDAVGHALVVHAPEGMSAEARALANSLAADDEHDLVVADLADDGEALAAALGPRPRGIRLLMATPEIARWLADRLGCAVLVPGGPVLPTAGGGLFVSGSGWLRYLPGKDASWGGRRFPCPDWDSRALAEMTGVVEPLPAGVWIRPHGAEEWLTPGRARLMRMIPCQPEVLTVVLGKEGTDELRLDDVERFWRAVPEADRPKVRFVGYGPVALPPETSLGQALADLLGEEVCCYLGVPVGAPGAVDVFTVRADRSHGWKTFAQQAIYRPGATPVVSGYRPPVDGFPEIAPAVYRCAPDAVVEVVPAGLWIRPDQVGDDAVRARPVDPDRRLVFYEAGLRHLAEEVLGRFDYADRLVTVLEAVEGIELYWLARLLGDPVERYLADEGGADLPTFRGACVVRVNLAEEYRDGQVIVSGDFWHVLTAPCATQDGSVEVLVWSMTGRRTASLEPDGVDGRVVFLPGTGFKVLEASADRLLLRELSPTEFERDGAVADNRVALDKTIKATLLRTADRWATSAPVARIPAASASLFQGVPS